MHQHAYARIFKAQNSFHLPRHQYVTHANIRRTMDQMEQNQAAMREEINTIKSNVYQILETVLALARMEEEIRNAANTENAILVQGSTLQSVQLSPILQFKDLLKGIPLKKIYYYCAMLDLSLVWSLTYLLKILLSYKRNNKYFSCYKNSIIQNRSWRTYINPSINFYNVILL